MIAAALRDDKKAEVLQGATTTVVIDVVQDGIEQHCGTSFLGYFQPFFWSQHATILVQSSLPILILDPWNSQSCARTLPCALLCVNIGAARIKFWELPWALGNDRLPKSTSTYLPSNRNKLKLKFTKSYIIMLVHLATRNIGNGETYNRRFIERVISCPPQQKHTKPHMT